MADGDQSTLVSTVTAGPGGAAGQQTSSGNDAQAGQSSAAAGDTQVVISGKPVQQSVPGGNINPVTRKRWDETHPGGVYLDQQGNAHDAHGNVLDPEALKKAGVHPDQLEEKRKELEKQRGSQHTDSERALRGIEQPVTAAFEPDENPNPGQGGGPGEVHEQSAKAARQFVNDAGAPGRPTKESVDAAKEAEQAHKDAQREREQQQQQQQDPQRRGGQKTGQNAQPSSTTGSQSGSQSSSQSGQQSR